MNKMDKVMASAAEAVTDIPEGASPAVGGGSGSASPLSAMAVQSAICSVKTSVTRAAETNAVVKPRSRACISHMFSITRQKHPSWPFSQVR
ncbi:hypothetical protein [Streptomyces sp. FL07-04A]|uniref:hypothetical protein n=1 Tax=Streptomyces sp. FL07-04A TaxID=3028658 RepID=UPI0029A77BAB|nr:hypothetical protein [Streptomyces sp. FL07-04A]MDX3578949.1 hypothetical protein [Streptomyces sp. FL07-04A]